MGNICHLSSVHSAKDTRILIKECSSLAELYDVTLIAIHDKREVINNVRIIPFKKIKNRFIRIMFSPIIIFIMALKLRADIYHLHDPELIHLVFLFKIFSKARIIYDAHEHFNGLIMLKEYLNPSIKKILILLNKLIERIFFPLYKCLISATPLIKLEVERYNSNSVIINNFPLLSEFRLSKDWASKRKEVCYIGNITKDRGIDKIIKALEYVDVTLNLAGNYDPISFRNELIDLPGWNKVNEFGFVDRNTVAEILDRSLAGIITLQPYENYIKSYPNKLFEYMAAEVPIIGSNFKLWEEFVVKKKCGILVDPQNPHEIANAIKYILNNKDKAKIMGRNGRIAVEEKYNWQNEEKKLFDVYNKLIGS